MAALLNAGMQEYIRGMENGQWNSASVGKVLAIIFWDRKGFLLLEYCPKGSTVTYFDA